MVENGVVVIKRHVIGWGIAILSALVTCTTTIIYQIGHAYVGGVRYVQQNEDDKKIMNLTIANNSKQITANIAAMAEFQKQLNDQKSIVEKHEAWFNYMAGRPQPKYHSLVLNK